MAFGTLYMAYTVLVLLVALGGIAVVVAAGDAGEESSTRMGMTAAAVALFVVALVVNVFSFFG